MKRLLPLLGVFFIWSFSLLAQSAQIAGGDLEYTCSGQGKYDITLHVVKQCNSIGTFNTTVVATPACTGLNAIKQKLIIADSSIVPLYCGSTCDPCTDSTCQQPFGFITYTLKGTIDLGNSGCDNWVFSWTGCCRDSIITNGTAGNPVYLYAKVFHKTTACSNSPHASGPGVILTTVNQCTQADAGFLNPWSSDSIYCSLAPPQTSDTGTFQYSGTYTYEKPLYFNGFPQTGLPFNPPQCRGFHLDSVTGSLQYKPLKKEVTPIAVKAILYKKGVKISESNRELLLINMAGTPNNPPSISGINGTGDYTASTCPKEILCFTMRSDDLDQSDSVKLNWNGGIPGATFTFTWGQHPSAKFCWTPQVSDVRAMPYNFTLSAKDDHCPIPATVFKNFQIMVHPVPSATYRIINHGGGSYTFIAENIKPIHSQLKWQLGQDTTILNEDTINYTFKTAKKEPVTLTIRYDCQIQYTDTLNVSLAAGIGDRISDHPEIKLYPNPAGNAATLRFEKGGYMVTLFNQNGKQLRTYQQENAGSIVIQRKDLPAGIYFLQIQDQRGQVIHGKLIFE